MNSAFFAFLTIVSSERACMQYLQEKDLLLRGSYCEDCSIWRTLIADNSKLLDGCVFRCSRCRTKQSVRFGSFFDQIKKPLRLILTVIFFWSSHTPVTTVLKNLGGDVSLKTLIDYYNFVRDVCTGYFRLNPILLGGIGHVVQIDESKIGRKRKNDRGFVRNPGGPWVFGGIDTTTKKVVMFSVPDRRAVTLIPLIQRFIAPGTTVFSDEAAMYFRLNQLGYDHHTVNHTNEFVAADGTHTNAIEGFWGHMKGNLKTKYGVQETQLNAHLDEQIWFCNRGRFGNAFEMIQEDIKAQYPRAVAHGRLHQPVPRITPRPREN